MKKRRRPAKSKKDVADIAQRSAVLYGRYAELHGQYAELLRFREEIKLLKKSGNGVRRKKA
jgi:hypothetical protein